MKATSQEPARPAPQESKSPMSRHRCQAKMPNHCSIKRTVTARLSGCGDHLMAIHRPMASSLFEPQQSAAMISASFRWPAENSHPPSCQLELRGGVRCYARKGIKPVRAGHKIVGGCHVPSPLQAYRSEANQFFPHNSAQGCAYYGKCTNRSMCQPWPKLSRPL